VRRRPARSLIVNGGVFIDTVSVLRTRRRPSRPIWSQKPEIVWAAPPEPVHAAEDAIRQRWNCAEREADLGRGFPAGIS